MACSSQGADGCGLKLAFRPTQRTQAKYNTQQR